MTWSEFTMYVVAGAFAVSGLWCLARYFQSRHDAWFEDSEPERARSVWREERQGAPKVHSLREPGKKGIRWPKDAA